MTTSLRRNKRIAGPVDALLNQNQKQWTRTERSRYRMRRRTSSGM